MAITNTGHTKSATLYEVPADIIHAVSVVPMLAPMMMLMACARVSSEALTNETVITVVAVELCTAAVTPIPREHSREAVGRHACQDVPQFWASHLLECFAHRLHAEDEQCQRTEQCAYNCNRQIILSV